jgi:glycosyltransferase involved in cell wall biosynthesis
MDPVPQLSASVLICTYSRAALLKDTLASLRAVRSARMWEIVVVDNNSTDDTRAVVEAYAPAAAVPVRYIFEPRQGKSYALNTGIARCAGDLIVFTDDDVRVTPDWLDRACDALDRDPTIDYTGGPVRPMWETPPPPWIDQTRGELWGTLAILDYGAEPFLFEDRRKVPLGVNMAVRRTLVDRIGGFHPELGRRGRSLLGQEQAEFFARSRAAGARGLYVPAMQVQHFVPAARLTKRYFRRWWYWKGVSRARLEGLHRRTELGLDLRSVPYLACVPRFMWGQLLRSIVTWMSRALARDRHAAMRAAMQVAYAVGYVRGCWAGPRIAPLSATVVGGQAVLQ